MSLMYEPALRIDMREMVNSRFYQEQKEPELSAFFVLWTCHVWTVWVAKP